MKPLDRFRWLAGLMLAVLPIGCGWQSNIDNTYGRVRGQSINGTGAFAEVLRGQGHEVRAAIRANDSLADWADVIIRFAPIPGPIDREEANWITTWLKAKNERRLIYVPRDFSAEPEFWDAVIAAQPKGTDPGRIETLERKRAASRAWVSELPPRTKNPAEDASWFEFEPKPPVSSVCKTLEGPWAEGIDAKAAAITKHEVFKVVGGEDIYLSGENAPLAIGWTFANGSRVVVLANASFLLNASLLNQTRRSLLMRLVNWIGSSPRHVAFLEGRQVVYSGKEQEEVEPTSQFHLLEVPPFDWISAQFLAFLIIMALMLATRLGRPLPEEASGVERPSAHPEAIGVLLARTGRADAARFLLENYRRWRNHSPIPGRSASTSPPSR